MNASDKAQAHRARPASRPATRVNGGGSWLRTRGGRASVGDGISREELRRRAARLGSGGGGNNWHRWREKWIE